MSNLAVEELSIDTDGLGMGTGPSDILVPKTNDVFARDNHISILDMKPADVKKEDDVTDTTDEDKNIVNKVADVAQTTSTLNVLTELASTEDTEQEVVAETNKVSKDSMITYLAAKIEAKEFEVYDDYDGKTPIKDYLAGMTEKDRNKLIDINMDAIREKEKEQLKLEVYQSLPGSAQYIAAAIDRGATEEDLEDIYKALLTVEQTRKLDINEESDQVEIARSYLNATKFGNSQEIEDQINEWKEGGKMEGKAKLFKPKLDQMQEQQVQYRLQQQEESDKQQRAMLEYYNTNIVEALKDGDLNGMKLDRKRQAEFYDRLTIAKPSPISGKPVNSIGEALERIQFSDTPNYKLLIHADWLLNDPEGYWTAIKQMGKNEAGVEIEKKLKIASQNSKGGTGVIDEQQEKPLARKGLVKQVNPFKR